MPRLGRLLRERRGGRVARGARGAAGRSAREGRPGGAARTGARGEAGACARPAGRVSGAEPLPEAPRGGGAIFLFFSSSIGHLTGAGRGRSIAAGSVGSRWFFSLGVTNI